MRESRVPLYMLAFCARLPNRAGLKFNDDRQAFALVPSVATWANSRTGKIVSRIAYGHQARVYLAAPCIDQQANSWVNLPQS